MKEDLTRLGKGTIIYGAGQILTKLLSLLLLPLFTSYLTPADYGIISLLAVISFLAAPVFGLGLGTAIGIVYFGNHSDLRHETIWTSLVILVTSSLIFVLITFWFSDQISYLVFQITSYDTPYFVRLTALSTAFSSIIMQPVALRLQFEEKAKLFVTLTVVSTLITIALTVLFVVYLGQGVEGYIFAGLIGSISAFFLNFVAVIRWTRFSISMTTARQLLKLGYPIIPSFLFLFVIQNSGRYALELISGLADVGIYTIGYNFGIMISIAVAGFTSAWFPYFNSFINRQEEAKQIFGKSLTYYIIGCGSLSVLFFIFAKPVVALMTQPPFHKAYLVVGLIALGNFSVGIFSILVAGSYFTKKVYTQNFAQFGAAAVCIFGNFLLIPVAGIAGAGISFLIANSCLCLFQYLVNRRFNFLEVRYEWKRIKHFALGSLVIILLTFIPRDFTIIQDVLLALGYTFVLLVFAYLQLVPKEKEAIASSIRLFGKK